MSHLSPREEDEGRLDRFYETVRGDAAEGVEAAPLLSQQIENSFVSLYQGLSLIFTAWLNCDMEKVRNNLIL